MLNNETVLALAGLSESQVSKPSGVFAVAATFLFLKEFSPFMKKWLIVVTIYLLILMLESYHDYQTFFKYPHVFLKIFDIYLLFFIYGFYKKYLDKVPFILHFTVWLILIIYIIAAFTIKREVFSMSAFASNKRGFNSDEVYIFIICLTYFFNLYFYKKNFINVIIFFVVLALIIFSQQRTVWVSTAIGLLLNIFFINRSNFKIDFGAIAPVLLMLGIVAFVVSSFILTNEEVMATFEKRIKAFTEVENDDEGGTAAWRRRQWEAYLPIVEQNILIGLRLKGFELPGQFGAFTAENTGHHFHSYYLDKLFYFGIWGLLLGIIPLYFYILKLVFFVRKFITLEQIVLASYMMTFGVFGIGYDVPFAIYGLIGLGFAYLEKDYTDTDKKRKVTEKSIAISQ
ncbi:MAG: hypothetical protein OHK0057_13790 [Thermoflexibacter sp.]